MGSPRNVPDSPTGLKLEFLSYLATLCLGLVLAMASTGQLGPGLLGGGGALVLYTGFVFFLGISFPFYLKRVRRLIG